MAEAMVADGGLGVIGERGEGASPASDVLVTLTSRDQSNGYVSGATVNGIRLEDLAAEGTRPMPAVDIAALPWPREQLLAEPMPVPGKAVLLPGRHHRPDSGSTVQDDTRYLGREIESLSDGSVARVRARGPVLAAVPRERQRLRRSTFTDALSSFDQMLITVMSGFWLASVAVFWRWWLQPTHRAGMFGLIVNSAVLAYISGFPAFFIVTANRLRKVNPDIALPLLRVAFVVTHAPSEPWEVARVTLDAMLSQVYPLPYDVWICSERPTE
jgi:hypothetical protein